MTGVLKTAARIAELGKMPIERLRGEYVVVVGEPAKSHNKEHLVKKIVQKLREEAKAAQPKGGIVLKSKLGEKSATPKFKTDAPTRDPRLPAPGTVIRREYHGKTFEVIVKEKGVEYGGKAYRSLSGVARVITGSIWNGFLFFGLLRKEGQ